MFREEVSVALERFGVSLVWRARVLGLLDAIAEIQPLAVVLSADLPGGEPIELLRSIRAHAQWQDLPVYLVSSELSREEELQAFVEGADAVLSRETAVPEIVARTIRQVAAQPEVPHEDPGREVADAAFGLFDEPGDPVEQATVSEGVTPASSVPSATPTSDPRPVVEPGDLRPQPTEPPAVSPTAPSVGTPLPASPSPASFQSDVEVPIGVSRPATEVPEPPPAVVRPATHPVVPDVIIVEDDPSLLEMLRYALTNRGYQTLSFSNGLDALRAMREMDTAGRHPVVLLDVDLPGIDGFRILHELSGSRPGDYQVILCTIHNSEATQVLGIQSGALDYLVKPLRMPIVLAKVERLVGRGSFNSAAQA